MSPLKNFPNITSVRSIVIVYSIHTWTTKKKEKIAKTRTWRTFIYCHVPYQNGISVCLDFCLVVVDLLLILPNKNPFGLIFFFFVFLLFFCFSQDSILNGMTATETKDRILKYMILKRWDDFSDEIFAFLYDIV